MDIPLMDAQIKVSEEERNQLAENELSQRWDKSLG